MAIITIQPLGIAIAVSDGVTLRDALNRQSVEIRQVCGGNAMCGTCRCRVLAGADNLSPPGRMERDRLHEIYRRDGWRLACQTTVHGDVEIEVRLVTAGFGL